MNVPIPENGLNGVKKHDLWDARRGMSPFLKGHGS